MALLTLCNLRITWNAPTPNPTHTLTYASIEQWQQNALYNAIFMTYIIFKNAMTFAQSNQTFEETLFTKAFWSWLSCYIYTSLPNFHNITVTVGTLNHFTKAGFRLTQKASLHRQKIEHLGFLVYEKSKLEC